jgi:pimeloyl-ACP methyl ester carboxylesterase
MNDQDLVIESGDGTELSARRVGSGSPLVLVHGGVVAKESWGFVEPQLAERHTVWSYDRRGHGNSGGGADHSRAREVDDLAVVLATAGPEVHLVGHSDGAFLCLDAAVHQPELRSLVLYEPTVHFDQRESEFRRLTELLDDDDLEGFLDVFLPKAAAASDDEIALLRSVPEAWTGLLDGASRYRTHRDAFARSVEDSLAHGWKPDRYRSVAAPTLLLFGALTQSPLFATPDEIREAIPHAEVTRLDDQRHMAAFFDPQRFASAVLAFTGTHD